jgi:hypothetical protein
MSKISFPTIPPYRQGQFALLLWGVIALLLLHRNAYGLSEGAAHALLLAWSIADQVANSVITFGIPDLRAILYLPIGYLWTGNIFVAKIFTVALLALAVYLFYIWKRRNSDSECALLASGLLLVSPMTLEQLDSLSVGTYLLAIYIIGSWLDEKYRTEQKLFGGWFFAQLLVCALGVSLHPAGLAYPASLLWSWRDADPALRKHQKYLAAAVIFVTLFILLLKMGLVFQYPWSNINLFQNPINSLATALTGTLRDPYGTPESQWVTGGILSAALLFILAMTYRTLFSDMTGRTLLFGLFLGLLAGDQSWGLIALTIILYFGIPLLLRSGRPALAEGFMLQRGWVLLLIIVCLIFFMHADRAHYEARQMGVLSAQDQLIRSLAERAENERNASKSDDSEKAGSRFIVASQWPARTMIACKCDTLPLPPAASNPESQLEGLHGVTYILVDPRQTANLNFAHNLSALSNSIETVALQPGGALLYIKQATGKQGKNP